VRIFSIVGARPQFIKVAPICWNSKENFKHEIIHTGQHYDDSLSESIFKDLQIPKPVVNFLVGSGSHAEQTSKIMIKLEEFLMEHKPDHVIVYGDTNSTLAGALVASKLGITISHVEAGLRSNNRKMPEELNRIATDHLSDILFAPTSNSMKNLGNEGLKNKSIMSGDIMQETIKFALENSNKVQQTEPYIYCTIHRAENTDSQENLSNIFKRLERSPISVRLFAHPRLIKQIKEFKIKINSEIIHMRDPLPYLDNINELSAATGAITDSGGLQKEAFLLGVPCLTLRNETEWEETLTNKWNQLDPYGFQIENQWWAEKRIVSNENFFGNGNTSQTIIEAILKQEIKHN
jgi:UDP-N-acetylglucosamine 2-epimerase